MLTGIQPNNHAFVKKDSQLLDINVFAEGLLLNVSVIVVPIDLTLNITLEYVNAIADTHLLALNAYQTLTMVVTQFQTVQSELSLILNKRSV